MMLINTDSEEFQNLSIIRQKQKHYENTGDFVRARKSSDIFNQLLVLLSSDLVKQIDEANKEQGE